MDDEDLDHLTNMRRLSMIEIEETLSELKNNIFSWSSLTSESREGLEPLRALIVQHLEEMLQELCHPDDEMQTDNSHSEEEDNSENTEDMDENEVRTSLSHFINRCLLSSSL